MKCGLPYASLMNMASETKMTFGVDRSARPPLLGGSNMTWLHTVLLHPAPACWGYAV